MGLFGATTGSTPGMTTHDSTGASAVPSGGNEAPAAPGGDDQVAELGTTRSTGERWLRMVGARQLVRLSTEAVTRGLAERRLSLSSSERRALRSSIVHEFVQLLRQRGRRLRGVSKRRFLVDLERSKDQALTLRDEAREELQQLRSDVADLRGEAAPPDEARQAQRIELFERRIAKLLASLADAEEQLERFEERTAENGIASYFRGAQGLDPDGLHAWLKRSLLRRLFEANLQLQGGQRA